jgi:hypothetical protein
MVKNISCLSFFTDLTSQAVNTATNIRGKYSQRKAIRDMEALGIMLRVGRSAAKKAPDEKARTLYFFLHRIIKITAAIKIIIEATAAILAEYVGYETP